MANLRGEALKQSFREQLTNALGMIHNPFATITFKFSEDGNSYCFPSVVINYACGELSFNGVRLAEASEPYVIDIILKNMNYDVFSYVTTDYEHGETKCHGFGEYWGEDKISIFYHRNKEEKNETQTKKR